MSDADRTIDIEIEVPGTPEQVWDAIATGPGVTSWMHPTEIEPRAGGRYAYDMGGGMNDSGTVTDWSSPRRFATEGVEWTPHQDAPAAKLATEWLVEARDGGSCVVRLVMSGFGMGEAWDNEIQGMSDGMRASLRSLRVYLTHFAGQYGTWMNASGHAEGDSEHAWQAFLWAVGVTDVSVGATTTTGNGTAPELGGVIKHISKGTGFREALLRIDAPGPGLAHLLMVGEDNWTVVQACLYGDSGKSTAARNEPAWQTWLETELPALAR